MILKLRVPEGGKKPDSFYEQLAARWTWLTITRPRGGRHRPASELAEANGVPVSTVHRWVKEARRRGILGPGSRTAGHPCRMCGQPMTAEAIEFDRRRVGRWARSKGAGEVV